jgi:hypothetical protein
MVRKITEDGYEYGEPPYTAQEEADMQRRMEKGPVTFTLFTRGRPEFLERPGASDQREQPEKNPDDDPGKRG